ncbi:MULTISPECIES: hypothetical protein [Roseomonadaceae]|uniref:Aldehyde dehydrogenase n=1 Tax=Falsiroseomonas oleicola TaxID=2801474 RepID=A0ABS6HBU5_9PROT|nr:hypothetical protein [Roseomonas oleicola]MBU8545292.1 hypothetical protein [Roseomonas oleicola]
MRLRLTALAWLAILVPTLALGQGASQADEALALQQRAEEETVLTEGEGRSEVFGYCTACHNTALIRRSRFTRPQWDGLMDWMTERHGMNPLEGEFRDTIVDYLARHYGPAQAPARGRNPFLN